jgi:ABC-type dipeptide/oligopeptide/nickel transport system ATPase component
MNLLEVKNLHTYFKTRKGIVKAVNDVSYSLEPGKTIGIVGESGSGKSVSAMSILQLLDGNGYIAQGEVLFEGEDLTKLTQQQMYDIRGNKISVIFQEPMTSLNPVCSESCLSTEKTGFSEVIGSWKMTDILLPRIEYICASVNFERSSPSKRISPSAI